MQRLISLREANQHLAQYVQVVEQGEEIIITRRGKPIAKMIPITDKPLLTPQQEVTRKIIMDLMKKGISLKGETFQRDHLHER
jgi:prevent-host-death family protein